MISANRQGSPVLPRPENETDSLVLQEVLGRVRCQKPMGMSARFGGIILVHTHQRSPALDQAMTYYSHVRVYQRPLSPNCGKLATARSFFVRIRQTV